MGQRGPKPTPTPILKLRGSWRASRRKQGSVEYNRPAMPQWLIGDARTEWKRIIPILEKMGILAEVDRTMLALYCKAYAEWREADGLVGSLLKKNPSGRICPHPALVIRDSAFHRLYKTCSEFGMSPSSRTGLAITPKSHKQDDDKSRFFYRKQTHEPDSA